MKQTQVDWLRNTIELLGRCLPQAHISSWLQHRAIILCEATWTIRVSRYLQPPSTDLQIATATKGQAHHEKTIRTPADLVGWLSWLDLDEPKGPALKSKAHRAPWTHHLVWEGMDTDVRLVLGDEGRTLVKAKGSTELTLVEVVPGASHTVTYTIKTLYPHDPKRPVVLLPKATAGLDDVVRHLEAIAEVACHRNELGTPFGT